MPISITTAVTSLLDFLLLVFYTDNGLFRYDFVDYMIFRCTFVHYD